MSDSTNEALWVGGSGLRDDLADRRERHEIEQQSVQVSFQTRSDIMEMTDADWITLGKFVAEVAAGVRQRHEEGKL